MNIQRGLVKDLGYDDTECTFVTGKDDVQYYFVNGTTLTDGLYVVTPNVKEAVGHEVYSTLGVIDENLNIIIPCANKRIELVADHFLLVEKTEVESIDVKNSIAVKDDPMKASTFNNDSLNIKQAMQNEMGPDGVFIFDDMFSEANLYDLTGNKILGDEYTGFSFIGQVGNDLYLHTININDAIKVIKTPSVDNTSEVAPIAPTPGIVAPTAPETTAPTEENHESEEIGVAPSAVAENTVPSPVMPESVSNTDVSSEVSVPEPTIPTPTPMTPDPMMNFSSAPVNNEDVNLPDEVTPTAMPDLDLNASKEEVSVENDSSDVEKDVSSENINPEDKYLDEEDKKEESHDEIDTNRYDKYIRSAHEKEDVKNAVYDEAVEVIRNLVDKNKRLENDNESGKVRIKELELDNKDFAKTIKSQRERIEKLERDNESHVSEIRRYKQNIDSLETEKREFLRTIESQNRRLEDQENKLRNQDEELSKHESGKEELVKLLEDVTEVLD